VESLLLRFRIPNEDEKTYEPDPAWHLLDGPRQPGYIILATFGPAAEYVLKVRSVPIRGPAGRVNRALTRRYVPTLGGITCLKK